MDHGIIELEAVELRIVGGRFCQDKGLLEVMLEKRLPIGEKPGFISEVYREDVFLPKSGFEEQGYIWVESREKAEKLIAVERSCFKRPELSCTERAVWKRVGKALERLAGIKEELEEMGAIQAVGMMTHVLPARFVRADERYRMEMAELERQIKSGQVADFRYLLNKPVDLETMQARLKTLNDDRINLLITLRGFQEMGLEFRIPDLDL